jgi:hypothetical protein
VIGETGEIVATGVIAATGETDSIAMAVVIGGTGDADAAAAVLAAESSRRSPTRLLS